LIGLPFVVPPRLPAQRFSIRAKAAREGLAYCLPGSGCRDGSVGRDGGDDGDLVGGGCRDGTASRAGMAIT
jgi:hypothetical protein